VIGCRPSLDDAMFFTLYSRLTVAACESHKGQEQYGD